MANKTICMLRLQRLFQLKSSGKSNRAISRLLSINRKTIDDNVKRALMLKLDFDALATNKEEILQEWLGKEQVIKTPDKQRKETLIAWFPYMQKRTGSQWC